MIKLFLLFVLITAFISGIAQTKVDSLLQLYNTATKEKKADFLLELSFETRKDSAKSNSFARQAYQLATKNHQVLLQAKAIYYQAETYFNSNSYQEAIPGYQNALLIYLSLNNSLMAADCHKAIGSCYYHMDQGEKAIAQFIEGMKLCENDKLITAKFLSNIAMTHNRMRNLNDAIDYYQKALALNTSINNHNGMASLLNNLSRSYSPLLYA